jgi:hypothetical protein
MNKPDDLEQLWKTQPVDPAVKGEEMRQIILKKTEKFDRTIWWRNIRETVAAAVLAAMGAYGAWAQHDAFGRASSVILVAASLWIIYYMWRHGTEPPDPNPDQTLEGYQRALVLKYDHQIRLLRNVKLWYLAPLYAGRQRRAHMARWLSPPLLYFAVRGHLVAERGLRSAQTRALARSGHFRNRRGRNTMLIRQGRIIAADMRINRRRLLEGLAVS